MKVTKAKGLECNTIQFLPFGSGQSAQRATGQDRGSLELPLTGSLRARFASPWVAAFTKGDAQRARNERASRWCDQSGADKPPAGPTARSGQAALYVVAFEALCFGDFHLGLQMKVTRPPGRDPACFESNAATRKATAAPRPDRTALHRLGPGVTRSKRGDADCTPQRSTTSRARVTPSCP